MHLSNTIYAICSFILAIKNVDSEERGCMYADLRCLQEFKVVGIRYLNGRRARRFPLSFSLLHANC